MKALIAFLAGTCLPAAATPAAAQASLQQDLQKDLQQYPTYQTLLQAGKL